MGEPVGQFVQMEDHGDGSADFTVTFADDDHKFSVSGGDDSRAVVQYEETLSWRGKVRVNEPDDAVFKALMTSAEMSEFLEDNGLDGVRRSTRQQR
jgi:hypothetical protein